MRYGLDRSAENDLRKVTDIALQTSARIAANAITGFTVTPMPTEFGITIAFTLASSAGITSVLLRRNVTLDVGSSTVVNSWSGLADGNDVSWADRSQDIVGQSANYWLELVGPSGSVQIGPQSAKVATDNTPPSAIASFSASHEAQSGAIVLVGVTFVPVAEDRFGSCKIYVSGYEGKAGFVAVAQNPTSPFNFPLKATGETVTLKAIAVSNTGIEALSGPTVSLTLTSGATVPAKVVGISSTSLTTGTQVAWPANPEANVTSYKVYRALYRAGFGTAILISTVSSTGASRYSYLDPDGTLGFYEYYVVAHNAIGDGPASDASPENNGSENIAPNVPTNRRNNATVDSIDQGGGTGTTIRVYGPGGMGSTWKTSTGFGDLTYPYLTLSNKAYSTTYYVCYDGAQLVASTVSFDVLPDGYIWCGQITTVAMGGGGGTGGGGGSGGGSGGVCFSGNTKVKTPNGPKQFYVLPSLPVLMTEFGPREAKLQISPYEGLVYHMGLDEWVTPKHPFKRDGRWVPANEIFSETKHFSGHVYNAHILTDKEEERHYILENGETVHNMSNG